MGHRAKWAAGLCGLSLLLAGGGLGFGTGSAGVEVSEERVGPFSFAYLEHVGDYRGSGRLVAQVTDLLERAGLPGCTPLAVYHDDPASTERSGLRAEVGCAIDARAGVALQGMGSSLSLRRIVARRSMVVRLPWRGPLSFVPGYEKVGPALERHRTEHDYVRAAVLVLLEGEVLTYAMPAISPRTTR